jgi:hypothetical protein
LDNVIEPLMVMHPSKNFTTPDEVNQVLLKGISALQAGDLMNCMFNKIE